MTDIGTSASGGTGLALWGGLECTFARIGATYRDQIVETGHRDRTGDLERIAALGIRTLRYPLIWETVAPDLLEDADWSWHDARLEELRTLAITPIAGLVHHGSGPRHTSLLDPAFPDLLARYADQVARRYPWIEDFTPVNEPLTTARFSALYGHWYPHARDTGSFLRALVIQCRAVVQAMRAIRRITPAARLVQTEDLGKTFSTPCLGDQAAYENDRRWLSLDLLCGTVDRAHPWYSIFLRHGVSERDLAIFLEGEGAPDILGINHYLTSERFLDHRLERYPRHFWGNNNRHRYADVEAVRVRLPPGATGPEARLREAFDRYGLPIAVTEAHHGCSREEQLRWLLEVWTAATKLRTEGKDLRAVTVWSLFGALDWNTLLVEKNGFYEAGAFDIRSDPPRPTLIATAAKALSTTGNFKHPVLDRSGWWRRNQRFYHRPGECELRLDADQPRRLIVFGSDDGLDETFARLCDLRGLDCVIERLTGSQGPDAVESRLDERAWAVVDTSTSATSAITAAARARGLPVLRLIADCIHEGQLRPGRAVASPETEGVLVVRTGPLLDPWDPKDTIEQILTELTDGRKVKASEDVVSASFRPDGVHAALDLLIDGQTGDWRLVSGQAERWCDLVRRLAKDMRVDEHLVMALPGTPPSIETEESNAPTHSLPLPSLAGALERYVADRLDDPRRWQDKMTAAE